MTSQEAFTILNLLPGIGPVTVKRLLEFYEFPEDILREQSATLEKVPGIGPKLADTIAHWRRHTDLASEIARVKQSGVLLVTLADADYPVLLKEIYDPPLCLYVRGHIEALRGNCSLAVVGSRRTSRYGLAMAERLTIGAIEAGLTIVSGLARGIDTIVHQTTVDNDGCTIAVLAGGLAKVYPPENIDLARSICRRGAVITEQPMDMKPDRRTFPMRNRIVSGMCSGTVVIEAGARSGALITARQAVDQGRQAFAVPGRADTPFAKGCNQLIKQGAKLVETIEDILEEFQFLPGFESAIQRSESGDDLVRSNAVGPSFNLTEIQDKMVRLLEGDDLKVDEIQRSLERPTQEILSNLLQLELKKVILQLPGKRFMLNRRVYNNG